MREIGFTGTQKGMSHDQKLQVTAWLMEYRDLPSGKMPTVHHGDCVGADEEFHDIAARAGCTIHIHPPTNALKRAFCEKKTDRGFPQANVIVHPPRDYLDRNHDIVDATTILLAAPDSNREKLRSGTWATVRYARKRQRLVHVAKR